MNEKNYVVMYEGEYGAKISINHFEAYDRPKRYRKCDAARICNRLNKTAKVKYFPAHENTLN